MCRCQSWPCLCDKDQHRPTLAKIPDDFWKGETWTENVSDAWASKRVADNQLQCFVHISVHFNPDIFGKRCAATAFARCQQKRNVIRSGGESNDPFTIATFRFWRRSRNTSQVYVVNTHRRSRIRAAPRTPLQRHAANATTQGSIVWMWASHCMFFRHRPPADSAAPWKMQKNKDASSGTICILCRWAEDCPGNSLPTVFRHEGRSALSHHISSHAKTRATSRRTRFGVRRGLGPRHRSSLCIQDKPGRVRKDWPHWAQFEAGEWDPHGGSRKRKDIGQWWSLASVGVGLIGDGGFECQFEKKKHRARIACPC